MLIYMIVNMQICQILLHFFPSVLFCSLILFNPNQLPIEEDPSNPSPSSRPDPLIYLLNGTWGASV